MNTKKNRNTRKTRKTKKNKKTQKKAKGLPRKSPRQQKPTIRFSPNIIKKSTPLRKKSLKIKNEIIKLINKDFYNQYQERFGIIGLNKLNLLNSKDIKISYFRGLLNDFNTIIATKFDLLRKGEHIENLSYNSKLEYKNIEKFDTKTKQICYNNKKTFYHCICCGKPITKAPSDTSPTSSSNRLTKEDIKKLECDHVINLLDMLLLFEFGKVDIKNNFVFIHSICNNKKKNMDIIEFITKIYNNQFPGPEEYDEASRISKWDRIKIINEDILKPLNNSFTTPEKTLKRHTLLLNATRSFDSTKQILIEGLDELEKVKEQSAANTLLQFKKNIH